MQKDTRRLTVALDHAGPALQEITTAQSQTEASMAEQAARRALDHLTLACRRLEHEQGEVARTALAPTVNAAAEHSRQAVQALHDALNDWEGFSVISLDRARAATLAALGELTAALEQAPEEAIHA